MHITESVYGLILQLACLQMLNNNCDYIPSPGSTFHHKESKADINYKEKAAALTVKFKKQNLCPKIWHDSFDRPADGRIHLYASNESLSIPYVSPMLAESSCDLPPLLLVRIKKKHIFLDIFEIFE